MTSFQKHYKGRFINMLRWSQLDQLWDKVKAQPEDWYIYFVGETTPITPADAVALNHFIEEIDQLLHKEHQYDYCGIVYADNKEKPSMVKIFDPHNLGSSCGSSGIAIPPRWLLTRILPESIVDEAPIPNNRKRWWQRLFSIR
ncbi:hypothetical protein [Candidatus Parabeggiatoa sp. HSG14]|uniref:hypothetical protein n=1 Tax=Candidatus Parabeggiatoa sp. HSG14 TaxID=3055593 RepID=UPI0025A829F3|nr:hypothetical protein [Thiotrichales bacterium HSG14]